MKKPNLHWIWFLVAIVVVVGLARVLTASVQHSPHQKILVEKAK